MPVDGGDWPLVSVRTNPPIPKDMMLDAMDEAAIADPDAESSSFMRRLKEYTLAGYYTSEVGATQELQVNPMGMHRGDIPYEEVGRSWA